MQQNDCKLCPYCAEEIKLAAIFCKHCGRELVENNQPTITQAKQSKKGWGGRVVVIIIVLSAIARYYDASKKADIKNNLDSNILYIDCYSCSNGAPLYDDLRVGSNIIGYVSNDTKCDVDLWYPGGDDEKRRLELEYGGTFPLDSFYYVNCGSLSGWIDPANTTRETPPKISESESIKVVSTLKPTNTISPGSAFVKTHTANVQLTKNAMKTSQP